MVEAVIEGQDALFIPTVPLFWREGQTLTQILAESRHEFQMKYAGKADVIARIDINLTAIEYMARFFVAGSLWMQQRILTKQVTPIERHFRKRVVKDHKLTKPMKDMIIVQLRRRQAVSETAPGSGTAVDWKCRWTVTGHWRNQPYKTTGKIEAIWIDAYVKGPDDKPMKDAPRKVYAVKR